MKISQVVNTLEYIKSLQGDIDVEIDLISPSPCEGIHAAGDANKDIFISEDSFKNDDGSYTWKVTLQNYPY